MLSLNVYCVSWHWDFCMKIGFYKAVGIKLWKESKDFFSFLDRSDISVSSQKSYIHIMNDIEHVCAQSDSSASLLSCPVFTSWLSRRSDFRSLGEQLTSSSVSQYLWAIGMPPTLILYTTLLPSWSPPTCLSPNHLQWETTRPTMATGTLPFHHWRATASTSRPSAKRME